MIMKILFWLKSEGKKRHPSLIYLFAVWCLQNNLVNIVLVGGCQYVYLDVSLE